MVGAPVPSQDASVPLRGTRPSNRRQLIIDAAADLIARNGYSHVSMIDIADAVAVRASALYRHFPSKQAVLSAVLLDRIGSFRAELADGVELASVTTSHRSLGVLWQREARHLDPEQRAAIEAEIGVLVEWLVDDLDRPDLEPAQTDLLVWCVIGVLASPSYHHVDLPGDGLAEILRQLIDTVSALDLPARGRTPAKPVGLVSVEATSRREQLLTAAIELFAERGYSRVGIEEIGAAAGVVGTNLYRYYPTKADVLLAAMTRGGEWLRLDLTRTLAQARTPADGLRGLVRSYARFTCEHSSMIDVLISETANLPEADQDRIRQTQRDYVAEWVHLATRTNPAESAAVARIRVQAALTVVNTVARSPRLRALPDVEDALVAVGCALLGVSAT